MSGSYIHIPPVPHRCGLPTSSDRVGTIWRCDDCGTYWKRKQVNARVRWHEMVWRNLFRRP